MTIGREEVENLAGQNAGKPWQSKKNARVRGKASKVDDEAVLHTCIPSIFPWTKSATPRNPPELEERHRQLVVALLLNTGEKPRARSGSTRLRFFPGRRLSGWRRWLCSE